MKIYQSTIERLLYLLLLLVFIALGCIYVKISRDDAKKFHVLQADQDQLICVVKGFTLPQKDGAFIDQCIQRYQ